jgi:alkylated DNA repair protein (DNA oxidative demethylase)
MSNRCELAPGVQHWRHYLEPGRQRLLVEEIFQLAQDAPFYRAGMPRSGQPLSVEMTNFGSLGWYSDAAKGYRYEAHHPLTGAGWPPIPAMVLAIWEETTGYPALPEACLVNLYRNGARMGLHRDQDEEALDAPVLSISLGDHALFRFGPARARASTRTIGLESGDVLVFGGPARLMFHGIDRIYAGTSALIQGGGRINLTLRRVNRPE